MILYQHFPQIDKFSSQTNSILQISTNLLAFTFHYFLLFCHELFYILHVHTEDLWIVGLADV